MMESYALKELSEAEMRRVEKHVVCCPKCRDRLAGELGWVAARRPPFKRYVEKLIEAGRKKAVRLVGRFRHWARADQNHSVLQSPTPPRTGRRAVAASRRRGPSPRSARRTGRGAVGRPRP